MKRMILMAAVLAVAACGRPDEDDYEETVYDRNNPPTAQPANPGTAGTTTGGAAATGTTGARGTQRDSMNTRFDSLSRQDSLRRDSLRQDSLRRRGTVRRDTTPQ